MNVFISVVSHNHGDLIRTLDCLSKLSSEFNVIVKSNTKEDISSYCTDNNILHLDECYNIGFGENNNYIYKYCVENLNMKENDIFIVLNPDVFVEVETIKSLSNIMSDDGCNISTINLFKDFDFSIYDNAIRKFPSLSNFILSFLGKGNTTIIEKSNISTPCYVDWAAGSFIAFTSNHYNLLNGFDESYFMYCEDIDICFRSKVKGFPIKFYPDLKAVHLAHHNNRKILSKHFLWHVKSAFRFLFTKYFLNVNNLNA